MMRLKYELQLNIFLDKLRKNSTILSFHRIRAHNSMHLNSRSHLAIIETWKALSSRGLMAGLIAHERKEAGRGGRMKLTERT